MKRLLGTIAQRGKSPNGFDSPQPSSPDIDHSAPSLKRSSVAVQVQERLSNEVLRKLKLATEAEEKEDRDIICGEVFADITGELNSAARESTGAIYSRWYQVLAPYFCKETQASEALLSVCRQLWGQPYTAPTYALLLHEWLLIHPNAGGAEERLKLLNILVSGSRQLFLGDVEAGSYAFKPLFTFITEQVVLLYPHTRLEALPDPARDTVMALSAAFLPYYCSPQELLSALRDFPLPNTPFLSPRPLLVTAGGADFAIDKIVDVLSKEIRSESAVLQYLGALMELKNTTYLLTIKTSTRIRLQGELYSLTQPGGPRYASRAVNRVAFRALDALFPHGRRTRRLINLWFRFLHPQEWPWVWWDSCRMFFVWIGAWIIAMFSAIKWPWRGRMGRRAQHC